MKTILAVLGLGLASAISSSAQIFRPETLQGAFWGGVAGAVIGHNDGRHGWEGAAYGAAAGALIGTWIGDARDHRGFQPPRHHAAREMHFPVYRHRPYVVHDIGRGRSWGRWDTGWSRHRHPVGYRYYEPVPRAWRSGDYTRSGVLLGGLIGAVVGHNDDRRGWEGAAYGAGAGLLLGSLADRRAARLEEDRRLAAAAYVPAAPASASAPSVTIINNYYGDRTASPLSSANGLFGR